MDRLLTDNAIDKILRYPSGRFRRLARKGLIPHVVLPEGELRFDPVEIEKWLRKIAVDGQPSEAVTGK